MTARRRHLRSVDGGEGGNRVAPYALSARAYFRAGWSPLPLPPGEKTYPPVGYTGGKGRAAEPDTVEGWIKRKPNGNVALRMPPNLIGIDVDDYAGKEGAETLRRAEEEWGPLPATWVTTSRRGAGGSGGVSGIRLFRIPEGLSWPGKLPQGGGVELCRWDHRYVIVAPSIHDETGAQYHWFAPDGSCGTEGLGEGETGEWEFPGIDELAELPGEWVSGLTSGKKWVERPEADLDPAEVTAWILDRPDGPLCEKMQRTLDLWMSKVSAAGEDGGAHDAARDAAWALLRDSAAGHVGVVGALRKVMFAHKEALKLRRPGKADAEWKSIKARGVMKVAAEGPISDEDECTISAASRTPRQRNRGSSAMDFSRDDIGNGRRFALDWRDEVRYIPAFKGWFIWNGKIWSPDRDDEVIRMAGKTISKMEDELQYIEDEKERAAFRKFIRSSSNDTRVNAMLRHGRANRGITIPAEALDADRSQLVCEDGTIELPVEHSGSLARRIPSLQEHLNTFSTGARFVPGARLPEWDKFLDRFQPDPEVRSWLQKLAGYSLLGANPRRLMVVCFGDTSTGKSTFAEAVSGALGPYGASANMTIFRDNQDERPRPDLIRVLPKRFVYAEEASRSWHLHPDQIKRLTGGTPVTARTLQAKVYVDMVPRFTPWLVTNNPPTIEGADAALKRRIVVVPFDVQIEKSEEDARFAARLASEEGRQAILAWLVAGYDMYLADPDSVQRVPPEAFVANAKFWHGISDMETFLDDVCETGDREDIEFRAKPMDLYKAYQGWCSENGISYRDIWSNTKFGREMDSDRFPKRKVKIEGKGVWFRCGIRLKPGWAKVIGSGS